MGIQEAGDYTIRWDGTNACGEVVSNGIYQIELKADKRRLVKKISLIK